MVSRAKVWAETMKAQQNAAAAAVTKMGQNRIAANFAGINSGPTRAARENLQLRTVANNKARLNAYTQKIKNSENAARNRASGNSPNFTARLRSPLNNLAEKSPYKSWWGSRKTRRSKKNRSTRKRK